MFSRADHFAKRWRARAACRIGVSESVAIAFALACTLLTAVFLPVYLDAVPDLLPALTANPVSINLAAEAHTLRPAG
jgi:hypothetical protein